MEDELLVASSREVKVMGIKVAGATPAQLRIYVNGKDVMKLWAVEEVRVTIDKGT